MRNIPLIVFAIALIAAAGLAVWALLGDPQDSRPNPVAAENAGNSVPSVPLTPAPLDYNSARDTAARLAAIEALQATSSDDATLRQAILTDADEAVRLKALEKAVALAAGEDSRSRANLLRTVIGGTQGNVKAAGLKAAREYPTQDLEPDLLRLVDSRDEYAAMALNVLAFAGTPAAAEKIVAVAGAATTADDAPARQIRVRAVALLGVVNTPDARELLARLANDADEEIRRVAAESAKLVK